MAILREIFYRLVVWQSRSGFVAEAGPSSLLLSAFPDVSTDRLQVATGAERPVARRQAASFLNMASDFQEHVRLMQRLGCPVRFVALAEDRHVLWYEESLLDMKSERQGPQGYAANRLDIVNNVFDSGILQGPDLLYGIPWECASGALLSTFDPNPTEIIPGTVGSGETFDPYVLADADAMPGYIGPYWQVSGVDVSVGPCGTITLSGGEPAVLEMELPIGGARLQFVGAGTMEFVDYFGNLLKSVAANDVTTVPIQTMFVRLTLTSASTRPLLQVSDPGDVLPMRSGDCVDCIDGDGRATVLCDWDVASDPSYFECPTETICIFVGGNTAPYIYDCPPLAGSGEQPSCDGEVCLETDAVLGADGIWRFTVILADNDEDAFTVSVSWTNLISAIVYPAGTFAWTVGPIYYSKGRSQRNIDFRVADISFGTSDTITFNMATDDGAGNTPTLSFDMVKECVVGLPDILHIYYQSSNTPVFKKLTKDGCGASSNHFNTNTGESAQRWHGLVYDQNRDIIFVVQWNTGNNSWLWTVNPDGTSWTKRTDFTFGAGGPGGADALVMDYVNDRLWAKHTAVLGWFDPDTYAFTRLTNATSVDARGLAFDPTNQHVYYARDNDSIRRINYDNTGDTEIATTAQIDAVTSGAINAMVYRETDGLLYCLDDTQGRLFSCDPSTGTCTVLIDNAEWDSLAGAGTKLAQIRLDADDETLWVTIGYNSNPDYIYKVPIGDELNNERCSQLGASTTNQVWGFDFFEETGS